jgi:hypothetical protein
LVESVGGTSIINVHAQGGETINGNQSFSYWGAWSIARIVCVAQGRWAALADPPASSSSGGGEWQYLNMTQPTGISTDPEVLYQFDGTASKLTDRTGNGHTLTVVAGPDFDVISPLSMIGAGFDETVRYEAPNSAALAPSQGTAEAVALKGGANGSNDTIWGYGGDPSVADGNNNRQWQVATTAWQVGQNMAFWFICENGLGTDSSYTSDSHMPAATVNHITATWKDSGGTRSVKLYQNGVEVGSGSVTTPDGGSSATIYIAAEKNQTQRFSGAIYSLKMTPVQFTADQVMEAYEMVRP